MINAIIQLLQISNERVNPSIATAPNDILVEEKSPAPVESCLYFKSQKSKDDRTISSISKRKLRKQPDHLSGILFDGIHSVENIPGLPLTQLADGSITIALESPYRV